MSEGRFSRLGKWGANSLRRWYISKVGGLGRRVFSQEGEDLILSRYFSDRKHGFYVDVGAHHPYRFSNTYLLYRNGWRGINIDAMPGAMECFRRTRPRDINVEAGIGTQKGSAKFFLFNEPALNTFDEKLAAERNVHPWRIIGTVKIPIYTLAEILRQYLPPSVVIDFFSIDVEGRDLEVLRSNDWHQFRPRIVLAETLSASFKASSDDPVRSYMTSLGYDLVARTFNTSFFIDSQTEI